MCGATQGCVGGEDAEAHFCIARQRHVAVEAEQEEGTIICQVAEGRKAARGIEIGGRPVEGGIAVADLHCGEAGVDGGEGAVRLEDDGALLVRLGGGNGGAGGNDDAGAAEGQTHRDHHDGGSGKCGLQLDADEFEEF